MAFVDARGAQVDFSIVAAAGINSSITLKDDGVARDLTSITITAVLKDDTSQARDYGGEYGTETSITMTVTDAANGIFKFVLPKANFANKEGGRLSYECYQDDGGDITGVMWGYIEVQERG
jgi:hypothetical protein